MQYVFFELLLLSRQTISWKWLVPKVYDSPHKPIFFLFFLIFVSLLGLACWNLVTMNILMPFVALQPLIISPCSLPLCGLKVLIFLVWPHVLAHIGPQFFHLPFPGLSRNPASLLRATNLTQYFKSRCSSLILHALHGAGQSSMLIWSGGLRQTGREKYFKVIVRVQFGNFLCPENARGNDSLGSFSVPSNLNGSISKACGS